MTSCEKCDDATATERVQARIGDVAVGVPLKLCEGCADEVTA